MGRTISVAVRFLIGIVSISVAMKFMGISWKEVSDFLVDGLSGLFQIINAIKGMI